MRIAVDARHVADHFPGIGRYVFGLLSALAELDHGHTLLVIHSPAQHNTRFDIAALTRSPAVTLVECPARPFSPAEQLRLPQLLHRLRADLYHSPYYVMPYVGLPHPTVVTLYDVIPRLFPHEVSPRARLLFDLLSRAAIRAADAVIAISESARDDIARAYDVPRQRFAVTPLAADARFRPQPEGSLDTVRRRHDLPQHYVLCVSSSKPHKNLPALVEAWARLTDEERGGCSLVLAGHFDPRSLKEQRLTEHSAAEGTVHVLPDLAEADLPALYAGAKLFVFPSRYEGFGLPPLEAMACGAPVICGPTSSLPEVVGDAGLVVDVTQPAALAAGIARALADPQLRSRMREQGLTRAASFSWRRTAELTLQVYEGAASARAG